MATSNQLKLPKLLSTLHITRTGKNQEFPYVHPLSQLKNLHYADLEDHFLTLTHKPVKCKTYCNFGLLKETYSFHAFIIGKNEVSI